MVSVRAHGRKTGALAAVAVLSLLVLSGCMGKQARTEGTLDSINEFDDFTWNPPQVIGPNGLLFSDGSAPHFVEQLSPLSAVTQPMILDPRDGLALVTMSPPMAVDNEGNIYVATLDEIHKSTDGGATWNMTLDFLRFQDEQSLDRWETTDHGLWHDASSGTLYALFSNVNGCQLLFASIDTGGTWSIQSPNDWPTSCADAQDVWVGPIRITYRPQLLTGPRADMYTMLPGMADHDLYICEETMVGPKCATSIDGGKTFIHEAFVAPPTDGCGVQTIGHGDTRDGDGVVALPLGTPTTSLNYMYIVNGDTNPCPDRAPEVTYSTDGGFTWQIARAPVGINAGDYPSLTFSASGTAYLAYRSGEQTIQLLRSPDLFVTWEGPFNLTLPQHILGDHPAVTVGDDGRVTVSYLASTTHQKHGDEPGELPPTPDWADTGTIWHLFMATSLDADGEDPTWHVQQVTPMEDPMHMGCIYGRQVMDWSSFNYACYNMGLWTDIVTGPDGRVYASLIDGCTPRNGCAADVAGAYAYRDRQVMVATLDSGTGLVAMAGVLPSLGLVHPSPIHEADDVYSG